MKYNDFTKITTKYKENVTINEIKNIIIEKAEIIFPAYL